MKSRQDDTGLSSRWIRPLAVGCAVGAATGAVLLMLAAAALVLWPVSAHAVTPIALAAVTAATLVGGFFAARAAKSRGWLYGALCGAILFLLIALIGILVWHGADGSHCWLKGALMVIGGAVGGVIGVNWRR